MEFRERAVSGAVILDVDGRLVLETSDRFHAEFGRLVQRGYPTIVLDLAGVSYVDSAGLGQLIEAHQAMRRAGGALKLLAVPDRLRRLLEITHLGSVFETIDSERDIH